MKAVYNKNDAEALSVIFLCDTIENALTYEDRRQSLAEARRTINNIGNEFYRKMLEKRIRKYSVY